jgi:hypothetical protein
VAGGSVVTVAWIVAGLHVLLAFAVVVGPRPQRGVLLLAALAPFSGLLLLVPHPPLVDLWSEALVAGTAVAALAAPAAARRQAGGSLPGWVPALLALMAVGLLSAAAVGGTQAITGFKINYYYALLLPILWRCPLSARERDHLVSVLMGTGVLVALVGLWQQAVGQEALHDLGYEYNVTIRTAGGLLRSFSTFNQPFPFGLYLTLVLLVATPVALRELQRPRNALFLALTPVLILGMLSSIVRAAIAGLAVGGLFLWRHRDRRLAHAVPVVLVVLLLLPPRVYGPLLSATSLGERSSGWAATFGEVLAAPFGNGIGASGSAAEKTALVVGGHQGIYQPDNYYFKTLYELGPIGLWLFVLFLISVITCAVATSRAAWARAVTSDAERLTARRDASLAAGIGASVLGACVASFVSTYFEIFPVDLFFWLLLGVLPSLHPASPSPPSPCAPEAAASRPTSASSSAR